MADEILETPAGEESPPVQTQTQSEPVAAPVQAAPPPAAALVINGVKSEREIQLEQNLETARETGEREKRELETKIAERERDIQELKKIPKVPAPKKERFFRPLIDFDDE